MKNDTTMKTENQKPIQSKPKFFGSDWIGFDFKTKPIG